MSFQGSLEEWHRVFMVSGTFYAVGTVVYLAFASDQLQPWAQIKPKEAENEKVLLVEDNGKENNKCEKL